MCVQSGNEKFFFQEGNDLIFFFKLLIFPFFERLKKPQKQCAKHVELQNEHIESL